MINNLPDNDNNNDTVVNESSTPVVLLKRVKKARRIRKTLKIILVSLISFMLIVACTAVAVVMPLVRDYYNSVTEIPFISRSDDYTLPPMPTGTFETVGTEEFTETETETTDIPVQNPNNSDGIYIQDKKDPDVENILIIGTDSRDLTLYRGRSDSMMICSYNKRTGTAKLVSLLRDMLVHIEGYGWNRLNAAYSFGGISLCINTINNMFDLDIQRFVIINFEGTQSLVDACGGVDLALTDSGSYNEKDYIIANGGTVSKNSDGTYHLDGKSALIHMRQRKGSSDFKRTERQRNVIMAIFRQVVSTSDVSRIYKLVQKGFSMVKTNITLDHMYELALDVAGNGADMRIDSYKLPTQYQSVYYNFSTQSFTSSDDPKKASVLFISDMKKQAQVLNEYLYGK